jgi:hypothetical protein
MTSTADRAPENEVDYYARRAAEALDAAEQAATLHARAFHHAMAETYFDRAAMLAHARQPLSERERLWIDRAIAVGLAVHTKYPHAREAHRRIAAEIQRRIDAFLD